jgi:uncharacterized protein (TIGR03083 family)
MLDRISAITADSTRVADLVSGSDTDLVVKVPSCPDWSLRDLVLHLGHVQRFWAANLRAKDSSEPLRQETSSPADADLATWMRASTDSLVSALADVGDSSPCWTWWGEPLTSGAVGRHQVQEAAVHRWDGESAIGIPAPLAAEVAHDGVGEFLAVMHEAMAALPPGPVVLVSGDTGGRWTVGEPSAEVSSSDSHGHGQTFVRASASDLVLLLYGRISPAAVEIEGDAALVRTLLGIIDTE